MKPYKSNVFVQSQTLFLVVLLAQLPESVWLLSAHPKALRTPMQPLEANAPVFTRLFNTNTDSSDWMDMCVKVTTRLSKSDDDAKIAAQVDKECSGASDGEREACVSYTNELLKARGKDQSPRDFCLALKKEWAGKTSDADTEAESASDVTEDPPISPTMANVLNLTIQYFVVYCLLHIIRVINDFSKVQASDRKWEKVVYMATQTVNFCPGLCALIIGARMRALQLGTQPQGWAQNMFYMSNYSIMGQTILVLMLPLVTDMSKAKCTDDGDVEIDMKGALGTIVMCLRYCFMLSLYVGIFGIVASLWMIEAPGGGPTAPVSTTMQCVANLTLQYFAVYGCLWIVRLILQFSKPKDDDEEDVDQPKSKMQIAKKVFEGATITVAYCPMMCMLMIGARMRALQLDTVPQDWAQVTFQLCTWAIFAQTVMAIVVGFYLGDVEVDSSGDPVLQPGQGFLVVIKYCTVLALYGGVSGSMYSVATIEAAGGADATPPLSPAMQCVFNLTIQFYAVYFFLAVARAMRELGGSSNSDADSDDPDTTAKPAAKQGKFETTMELARSTCAFCPMLCVLFIGARMRAQQFDQHGNPQAWAQTCMFVNTWCVLAQTLLVILASLTKPGEYDENGNPIQTGEKGEEEESGGVVSMALTAIRLGVMLANYACIGANIYGVISIDHSTVVINHAS